MTATSSCADEIAALRASLALAQARAKVYRESAEAWRELALTNAEEIGRLQQRLLTVQGGVT